MIKLFKKPKRGILIEKQPLEMTVMDYLKTQTGEIWMDQIMEDGSVISTKLGENKVHLYGLNILAGYLTRMAPTFTEPSFEDILYTPSNGNSIEDLRAMIVPDYPADRIPRERYNMAFNVAIDGAQGDAVIHTPRHYTGIDMSKLIPFRKIPIEENDFTVYKQLYLHHTVTNEGDYTFVNYYSKLISWSMSSTLDTGTQIPNNPETTLITDRDSRVLCEFTLTVDKAELVEWFNVNNAAGAEAAAYNSIMIMNGVPAKINLDDADYNTMAQTHVFAKANHQTVPHGASGVITVRYKIMHV
jgi:hypothetical protein